MAIEKLAHCELRFPDVGKALEYNRDIFGLREIAKVGETYYLGCGMDDNYDLAIAPGGTGIVHFAFQVRNEDDLKHYKKRVEDYGIKVEERTDAEPGQVKAIGFDLPATNLPIRMELITVAHRPNYPMPAQFKNYSGRGPLDLDHIGIKVANSNKVADFLTKALDFKISDIFMPAPGVYGGIWARCQEYHHDIATLSGVGNPTDTLDHIAWLVDGIDQMKRTLDMLSVHGLEVEFGIGRHAVGSNLYAYYIAHGNRYELSAEMPRVIDDEAETQIWDDISKSISTWGVKIAESMKYGS